MKLQVIPDINLDNTKLLGLIENTNFYRPLVKRLKHKKIGKDVYIDFKDLFEQQHVISYEIEMTNEKVAFYLGFDDILKEQIETELNICWKNATYKKSNYFEVLPIVKELELKEHYFLSLKTDMRGEHPLSNILETKNMLRSDEKIQIRLELTPLSPGWYRELEECIKNFEKGRVTVKNQLSLSDIAYKSANGVLETAYTAIDIVNDIISDVPIEHDKVESSKYAKLLRNGLSTDTKEKSRYNGFRTRISIGINSIRSDILFRNIEKAFNSMAGDNRWIMVYKSKYKNNLCSKELAQIMQLPTKYYQQQYGIVNIDTREVSIPGDLLGGIIPIGTAQKQGSIIETTWAKDINIRALPKIIVGPQNAGKTSYIVNYVKGAYKSGDANIVIDFIQDCELTKAIEPTIAKADLKIIDLSNEQELFALAYTEASKRIDPETKPWERLKIASLLANQVEYLINSVTSDSTGELTSPMIRYLYAAAMVVFIHPGKTINDVFQVLRRWQVRTEYIRNAKYSGCFSEDDEVLYDLEELHERDKDGKIIGTRENIIIGILNRIIVLNKNIYLKAMLKAPVNNAIDLERFIHEGKTVIIRIPQTVFVDPQVRDTLVTYIMSRIWLTAQLRDQHDNKLCNIVVDEVHQVPTAANFVKNHITEFRRHRLGTVFTVHYLRQFKTLLEAVKSAGASYMLLAGTEKDNLKALEDELLPFTIQEGLNLKPYHSLNIINYGNQYTKFISKLPAPL